MTIINYFGAEGEVIVIDKPTDTYVLLDWLQSRMIENSEKAKGTKNVKKWERSADFITELMETAEEKGWGKHEDVDNIRYE